MTPKITKSSVTSQLKQYVFDGLAKHSIERTGIDGFKADEIAFELHQEQKLIGCIVVQIFFGQLHIKYLVIDESHRGQGLGKKLMDHVLEFAQSQNCHFASVTTMNFQAPHFYEKLGFTLDFVRAGYDHETSLYFLSKALIPNLREENE